MKKQIVVERNTLDFLRKTFNCSRMAIWEALHFESNSDFAKKIRHLAKQHGGELVGAKIEPETSFDTVSGVMTQTFGDRVKLTADQGHVTVYIDGCANEHALCESIPEFVELQNRVRSIAESL